MRILITICARGGSKGIPGKNIKTLNGIPLISYSINIAKKFVEKHGGEIVLSTDDSYIKNVASDFGLQCDYIRPAYLAKDTAGKIDAINDVINYQQKGNQNYFDYIIDLDVTSPLRTLIDLEEAFEILINNPEAYNIFSVSPANRNPYFNMVEEHSDGFVKLVKFKNIIKSRQEAPAVYDMNASFYIYRRSFFERGLKTAITEKSLAYVMSHLCFDLDHPHDFVIMEILLKENLLDFKI
jgi:CMP-N-acetylneuraminic acid synthetase